MNPKLFAGQPYPMGGLSNERDLAKTCPQEFQLNNPWSTYAMLVFFMGADTSNWEWKSENAPVRRHQLACFMGLLGSFEIPHEDKSDVAGWMLSEMLSEVPVHIPKQEGALYARR